MIAAIDSKKDNAEIIDYIQTVDALYSWLEKNSKKIFKDDRTYSEVFFQIYKISKRAYNDNPKVSLRAKDKTVILGNLKNLDAVLNGLERKRNLHVHSWALLSDLLQERILEVQEQDSLDIPKTYFAIMNIWACLENWEKKHLKEVIPVCRSIIRVQDKWPNDEESYLGISSCVYRCFGARDFYGFKKQ